MRTNKVTASVTPLAKSLTSLGILLNFRQTADTLMAAATFLDILSVLGPLDPEATSKVKFAKYHALRILKALKQGQDPNLTNPAPEPDPGEEQEVVANEARQRSLQPSVEDAPDEHDISEHRLSQQSALDQSSHPSGAPSIPRPAGPVSSVANSSTPSQDEAPVEDFYKAPPDGDVSPLDPENEAEAPKPVEYFPHTPADTSDGPSAILPSVPSDDAVETPRIPSPSRLPPRKSIDHSNPNVQNFPPNPPISPEQGLPPRLGGIGFSSPSQAAFNRQPAWQPPPPSVPQASMPQPTAPPAQVARPVTYNTDDESVMKAQKHCRWAISALNFEDSATAVKELKSALQALGAA